MLSFDLRFSKKVNLGHDEKPHPVASDFKISYGTAGFRDRAEILPFVAYRVGYLSALRARVLNKAVGLMITASHNPECDNGVKIVDPMGEMLAAEWEKFATNLVSASDEDLEKEIRALEKIVQPGNGQNQRVICAIDTRDSGQHLANAAKLGVTLCEVPFDYIDILTTPQLHYVVRVQNDPSFGPPGEKGYYERFSKAFQDLYDTIPTKSSSLLLLDCANGVGAQKAKLLLEFLPKGALEVKLFNEKGDLNHECGADFVKISKRLPLKMIDISSDTRCASLDGDADRLIYFRAKNSDSKEVVLLDGDKIAVLFAKFIIEQLRESALYDKVTVGIVQTAYANGASSAYIKNKLGVDPIVVPTGVKHLHHEAQKYDIGVYFEANGHGTICFSERCKLLINETANSVLAARRLYYFTRLINEVVGDALADLLAVELLLMHFGWTIEDWDQKLYHDAPNIQIKVPVADRSIYHTTWDETKLTAPVGLQEKIDQLVDEMKAIRCFARPSGTENIVRVYAEATNPETANTLGEKVAELIKKF